MNDKDRCPVSRDGHIFYIPVEWEYEIKDIEPNLKGIRTTGKRVTKLMCECNKTLEIKV